MKGQNYSIRANSNEAESINDSMLVLSCENAKELMLKLITISKNSINGVAGDFQKKFDELNELNESLNVSLKNSKEDNEQLKNANERMFKTLPGENSLVIDFENEEQKQGFILLMDQNKLATPLELFKALHNHIKQSLFKDLKV